MPDIFDLADAGPPRGPASNSTPFAYVVTDIPEDMKRFYHRTLMAADVNTMNALVDGTEGLTMFKENAVVFHKMADRLFQGWVMNNSQGYDVRWGPLIIRTYNYDWWGYPYLWIPGGPE